MKPDTDDAMHAHLLAAKKRNFFGEALVRRLHDEVYAYLERHKEVDRLKARVDDFEKKLLKYAQWVGQLRTRGNRMVDIIRRPASEFSREDLRKAADEWQAIENGRDRP